MSGKPILLSAKRPTAVALLRKGTRWHRTHGHIYLTPMVALNLSGLFIFRLFGGFAPFHWLVLISLLSLVMGRLPVLSRKPQHSWLACHANPR